MKKTCKLIISILFLFLIIFFVFKSEIFASNKTITENVGSGTKYKWTQTIVYHSNYPNSQDDTVTVVYNISHLVQSYAGDLKRLSELNFIVPLGYEEKSPVWNTIKDGSGNSYNKIFSFSMEKRNQTIHLYAQYKSNYNNFSLIYDAKGGTDAPTSQNASSLEDSYTFIISDKIPRREGYKFLGWSTSYTATTPNYYPKDNINVTSSTILYAVWEEEKMGGNYMVEWYDVTGKKIKDPDQRNGIIGDVVSVTELDKIINGYIFDKDNKENVLNSKLEYSDTVLKLYFIKKEDISNNPDKKEENNPITNDNIIFVSTILIISFISFVSLIHNKNKGLR